MASGPITTWQMVGGRGGDSRNSDRLYFSWFQNHCRWWFSSVQFSRLVVSDSLQPGGLKHARLLCPSPTPRACSNSCPSSQWCHPTISSSVFPFSSCLQCFPVSESFPMSQLFASGGQSIGVSASTSVLLMNTQDWSPLEWTDWISLESKGLQESSAPYLWAPYLWQRKQEHIKEKR